MLHHTPVPVGRASTRLMTRTGVGEMSGMVTWSIVMMPLLFFTLPGNWSFSCFIQEVSTRLLSSCKLTR